MSTAALFVISLLVCLVQSNAQELTVEQALLRAPIEEQAVRNALEKLPPNAAARQDGADVLASFQQGLKTCENTVRSNQQVPEYIMCVATLKGLAMASIGELAGEHWAKSGASRPTLFW